MKNRDRKLDIDKLNRLREAISTLKENREGLTNEAICAKLGYNSASYLSDILGGSKPISKFLLEYLRVEYSISEKWILEGEGKMFIKKTEDNNTSKESGAIYQATPKSKGKKADGDGWIGVPVFDVPLASGILEQTTASYVDIPRFRDCVLGIQVSGDSMSPKIRNGDYVLCKETDVNEIIMGDVYLILTHKGTEVIKYVYPHETKSDCILLVSDNRSLPPTELPKSSVLKIYKVKGIIKSY